MLKHSAPDSSNSPKDWQRFYLGYRERFVEDCCIQLPNGKEVRLKQAPSAKQFKQHGSQQHKQQKSKQQQQLDKQSDPALTGSTVWDGAVVLAQYLSSNSSPLHHYRAERSSKQTATPDSSSSSSINRAAGELDRGPSSSTSMLFGCNALQPSLQQTSVPQLQSCPAGQHCSMPIEQSNLRPAHHVAELPLHEQLQQQDVEQPDQPLHGLTCLELGAGTGAVSLSALAAGVIDHALVTDIPDMLPHLQSNVEHNSAVLDSRRALVLPLRWAEAAGVGALQQLGQQQLRQSRPRRGPGMEPVCAPQLQPPFELIVGSDLIYYSYTPSTPHSRLLLQALVQLAGPDSLIFLALSLHHNPEEVHAFLKWAETDWGFAVEHITQGIPAEYVVPDVLVVKLQLQDQRKAAAAGVAAAAGTLRRWDE